MTPFLLVYGFNSVIAVYNMAVLACHLTPLQVEDCRIKFSVVDQGELFDLWKKWTNKNLDAQRVILCHGNNKKSVACALGNSFFTKAPQIIYVDSELERIDVQAVMLQCKHEFAHIKYNHSVIQSGILLISTIVIGIFCSIDTLPLFFILAVVASNIYNRISEIAADKFAFKNATEEELRGGIRFFHAANEAKVQKTGILDKLYETHPSPRYRIDKLEKELKERLGYTDSDLYEIENVPLVENLRNHLVYKFG